MTEAQARASRPARTHCRTSDPHTSAQAAHRLDAAGMRGALLAVFSRHPEGLTSEEAAAIAGYDPGAGPWKRVSDLEYEQLITRATAPDGTTLTRKASTCRSQLVRVITDAGKAENAYLTQESSWP